ncbi:MAG: endopeptidase La [Deltaproteobacteria bacterium]|nr:endopeptidase La [Deltaproteobacteria bacterium]
MAIFKGDDDGNETTPEKQASEQAIPLLPLRDIVVFPQMVVPLFVGRDKSVRALEEAVERGRTLILSAQRNAKTDNPGPDDIYDVGTLGTIVQLVKLPDGTVKVLVEGKQRARVISFEQDDEFFLVHAETIEEDSEDDVEVQALVRTVHEAFEGYVKLNKKVPPEMVATVQSITSASRLADTIVAHLNLKIDDKQRILEMTNPHKRLEEIFSLMQGEVDVLRVEGRIRSRVKKQMERSQKEYYLNEQMRAIQKELGDKDEFKNEIQELEEQLEALKLPDEARQKTEKELKKLKMMSPMSAEATVVRNYIDWVLALPWEDYKQENQDIKEAEAVLESDHYGLEKPKERILEYLAVQALVGKMKGPILCLVGPPGVGKTSLGRSIARATGRDFVRISLGGVRDEAEIRGHRRTYIGALPGKIILGLKKAGTGNPVFLLDEVDKMSMDFRGDPSSALLEVLDPEQNHTFNDHYLDLDYDLSHIMFVTTANTLDGIPRPLQDRMEILHIPGYIEEEKLQIANRFLIPKQVETHGLTKDQLSFTDQGTLEIVRRYTKESGVRNLEREIAAVCRKVARAVVSAGDEPVSFRVGPKQVRKWLGVAKHRYGRREETDQVGIATGLAFTEVGGELLTIEALVTSGKGKVQVSGRLGDVMQESAQAAISYVRRRARQFRLARDFHQKIDLHVHVPEGGVPKDGPSAGITMAVAVTSALTGIPVHANIAMTGEITLRGRVLPIGGLKEKLIAALRGGIDTVLIPKENERDLKEIPPKVKRGLNIVLVDHMDEVLQRALCLDNPNVLDQPMEYPVEEIFEVPVEVDPTDPTVEAPTPVN